MNNKSYCYMKLGCLLKTLTLLFALVIFISPVGGHTQAQAQFFSGFAKFDKKKNRARKYRKQRAEPHYVSRPRSRRRKSVRKRARRGRSGRRKRAARRELRRQRRLDRALAAEKKQAARAQKRKKRAGRNSRRVSSGRKKERFETTRLRNVAAKRKNIRSTASRKKSQRKRIKRTRTGRINRTPLQVVISLTGQTLKVYQGTKVVASSRISSGKAGHRTPTGVFSILQKNRDHRSNIYDGASMPNMQRLTWSGIAMHAGRVPGYPASHGCIRLPRSFSKSLFRKTRMGAKVIVQNGQSSPRSISHPMLFQPLPASLFAQSKPKQMPTNWSSLAKTVTLVSSHGNESRVAVNSALFQLSSAKIERENRVSKTFDQLSAKMNKSEAPLRIFITRRTEKEHVREIQKMLVEFGYDIGQPNGFFGKKTRSALYMLQDEENMDVVNGKITKETEDYLRDITGYHLKGNGHLYIRQNFKDIFDSPVQIREASKALGTHIFTVQNFGKEDDLVQWVGLTVRDKATGRSKRVRIKYKKKTRRGRKQRWGYRYVTKKIPAKRLGTATEALDRLMIEPEIRTYISRILTPGSSMMISHHAYSNETGKGTDFVVKVR